MDNYLSPATIVSDLNIRWAIGSKVCFSVSKISQQECELVVLMY